MYDYDCLLQSMYDIYGEDRYRKPSSHYYEKELVKTIQDCEANCEHMTVMLKKVKDYKHRTTQIRLLRDCADICGLTAKYIARMSYFSKHIAKLCAYICVVCGKECAKFPDRASQNCAEVCFHCARECKAFAMRS
ncbi:hypothetical protein CLPU_13c00640 [Gottschalkia purinilytica]|uniref:Ferredoxin n=1 Tax=Gottschalkia purinilytica TaxID=1503 RepID=A0A0L0W8E7_GOTPU|nr:four-helix bundle copper-binding protein [Gottschalkia purinilytica]KNF07722.1 hypothetical protein CLPU_13c00640 [Gottschalkia purinilytica]